MTAKKKPQDSTARLIELLEELKTEVADTREELRAQSEELHDLKQMVAQIGANLDVMRGERTTSHGSKPFTGTTRPDDMPADAPKRLCPKCFGSMRWARNSSDGSIFAGCRRFPECRGTRRQADAEDEHGLSRDLSMKERAEAQDEDPPEPDLEDAPF